MKTVLSMVGVLCVSLGTVACGGGDDDSSSSLTPVAACRKEFSVVCRKLFGGCFTSAELDAAAATVGNNESDCNTKFAADNCGEEQLKCDSDKTYDPAMANECIKQTEALSCDEVESGQIPAACENTCK